MKNITALLFAITFIFATTSKQIYSVNGMMCGYGCVSTIKNSLNSLDASNQFLCILKQKQWKSFWKMKILNQML